MKLNNSSAQKTFDCTSVAIILLIVEQRKDPKRMVAYSNKPGRRIVVDTGSIQKDTPKRIILKMSFNKGLLDYNESTRGGNRFKTRVGGEGHFEGMSATRVSDYLLGVSQGDWYDEEEEEEGYDQDRYAGWSDDEELEEGENDEDYYKRFFSDVERLQEGAVKESEEVEHEKMMDWRKKSIGDALSRVPKWTVVGAEGACVTDEMKGISLKQSREILRNSLVSQAPPQNTRVRVDDIPMEYANKCAICQDEFEEGATTATVRQCGHKFCTECLSSYITFKADDVSCLYHRVSYVRREDKRIIQIFDHNAYGIPCPGHLCTHVMLIDELVPVASYHAIQRFTRFSRVHRENLEQIEVNRARIADTRKQCPDCGVPREMRTIRFGRLKCNTCGAVVCPTCVQRHPRAENCESSALYNGYTLSNRIRVNRCPGCHIPIIKGEGCNHMTCSQCQTEFCNLCGKKAPRDLYSHWPEGFFADTCIGVSPPLPLV
ncbi:hypothetical protein PROFUN_10869 [Planoprotostelium fungivorum]|uniref:RING-type domain-containing protein n=1 Tax=Planoprotostelium fungivorum TaxID=1890364 RepID=A0A2P6NC28_9EUKA|nr:hypothetical protein PROFUN_10869 [Planoprotostelium fungivorum]